jgi:hypothetical protein
VIVGFPDLVLSPTMREEDAVRAKEDEHESAEALKNSGTRVQHAQIWSNCGDQVCIIAYHA